MGESSSKENTLSTRKFFIVVKKIFFNIKLIPARIKDICIKIKTFFNEFPERTNSRSDLTSTNIFVRMLKTAIHDKNVQTIALLGDFSSGKSSILFSSLKKKRTLYVYPTNDFYEKTDIDTKKKIFLRSLVKSDIASISKNQDTYRHYIRGKKLIKLYTIAIVIWIILTIPLTYLFIKFSDIIKNFMSNNLHIEINDNLFTFIPTIICGGILVLVLIFYTLYICNYHIILKLNNVTIDSKDKTTDESVFTAIIFHLIRRKIKYVVFEDLDRKTNEFNYGLFRELRDFCLRINSSPQIKKPIKFIYCFSDSIFRVSDERLKSFDYIIPIFPKITMNNSYDELIRQDIIIEKQIDKNELSDLSIFITNQRLYNAIILEFRVMCSEIKSSNYNEIFALCCIKNIYPIIYNKLLSNNNFYDEIIVGMNGDINKFESASKDLTTKIRDIFQSLNQKGIDGRQNNTENDDFLKTIVNDATLLIKICILNKYLTSNYKNYIHGGTNFLSSNDRNYLKNIAAMEKVDPNIELTNFEVVLKSAKNLSNPKFFNISLLKYCLENQRKGIFERYNKFIEI